MIFAWNFFENNMNLVDKLESFIFIAKTSLTFVPYQCKLAT